MYIWSEWFGKLCRIGHSNISSRKEHVKAYVFSIVRQYLSCGHKHSPFNIYICIIVSYVKNHLFFVNYGKERCLYLCGLSRSKLLQRLLVCIGMSGWKMLIVGLLGFWKCLKKVATRWWANLCEKAM